MSKKMKVQFLIEPDNGLTMGDSVLAVFPQWVEPDGNVMCYSHIGQHSCAHPDYIKACTPATPEQYADLHTELTRTVGYDLVILE